MQLSVSVDNEKFIAAAKKHLDLKAINTREQDLPDLGRVFCGALLEVLSGEPQFVVHTLQGKTTFVLVGENAFGVAKEMRKLEELLSL